MERKILFEVSAQCKMYLVNSFRTILFLSVLLLCIPRNVYASKVYIDIDSPNFQKFPIAITDFQMGGKKDHHTELSSWFPESLSRYLTITGFFAVIDKKAFLVDPQSEGFTASQIRFTDWRSIGAEYLIKGFLSLGDDTIVAEMRLFDVVKGEMILSKRLSGKYEKKNEMVRTLASEVLSVLTGSEGVFDTSIAFVLSESKSSDIYLIDFDGSNFRKFTELKSLLLSPRWSPDGKYIAFTSYHDGNPDIYIQSLFSKKAEKIVSFAGVNLPGGWSREGTHLALTSSKDGNEEIYSMNVVTKQLKRLTYEYSIDVSPVWSPDNKRIAFVSNRAGSPQIYVMDANGDNVTRVTYEGNYNTSPAWSPRGDRIAYEGLTNGHFQIFTIQEDGSHRVQLTFGNQNNESPSWSPDGRYLVFSTQDRRGNRISVMNANGTNMRTLYECPGKCKHPTWSPRLKE